MEIIYVTVIGMGIATVLRYLLPRRDSYGILLLPGIGAAVTIAVWVALLWLGFTFDGGWIWVFSLVAGGLAALAVALIVSSRRTAADARELHILSGGKA